SYSLLRTYGAHLESRSLETQFKGFRRLNDQIIEVNAVAVWSNRIIDRNGKVVRNDEKAYYPQTITLVMEDGRWKIDNVEYFAVGNAPF
ncbi:MAG: hypothetical protein ACYC1C_21335, partial [Chloroflexota bacterium]